MKSKLLSDKYFIFLFISAMILLSSACMNRETEPQASESQIIDLWDNGFPRKVWIYGTVNGVKTPIKEIQYHPNGTKSMEGPLKEGHRHGEWKSWYDDGSLWSVGTFRHGIRHGKGIVYHPNGQKFIEGNYLDGQRIGRWLWWDENGRMITEEEAMKLAPVLNDE